MKTIFIKNIGFGLGAIDGVRLTNTQVRTNKLTVTRVSKTLVGSATSTFPTKTKMYVFFCLRLIIIQKVK